MLNSDKQSCIALYLQGGPQNVSRCQKIALNRTKACQWDQISLSSKSVNEMVFNKIWWWFL